ncbi:MAG: hypothetical protein M0Z69_09065 [Actinomycetota bacterium]|nr:hypothetical protein [Actinomycetota bacterium]
MDRMDREQFFARLVALDEERLKKALWNLYWRGTATVRQRIEAELDPDGPRPRRKEPEPVDPEGILDEVCDFVALARSGAYLAGDRRVSPRERTRWRFTFQRLVKDAERALSDDDLSAGAEAMTLLLDLAQEMRDYDYFRSEDPIEAARVVVSDEVSLLWSRVLDRLGCAEFARSAAPQLVRWESKYGWTRTGFGRVREQETSLTVVLERLLTVPDHWVTFTDGYLEALDQVAARTSGASSSPGRSFNASPDQRTGDLAEWHAILLDRLFGGNAEDRLDRLAGHRALGGPNLTYFQAQLARRRGDTVAARRSQTEGASPPGPGPSG